jgi:hypothetical protein
MKYRMSAASVTTGTDEFLAPANTPSGLAVAIKFTHLGDVVLP